MGAVPSCGDNGKKKKKKKCRNCDPGFDGCKPCGNNSHYKAWDSDDEFRSWEGTSHSLGKISLEEFVPGARVKVLERITSRNRTRIHLFPGDQGLVRQVHPDGHLLIRFENVEEKQWVSNSKLACLRVTGIEPHRENSSFLYSGQLPPQTWAAAPPEAPDSPEVVSAPPPNGAQQNGGADSAVPASVYAATPAFGMQAKPNGAAVASVGATAVGSMRAPAVYAAAPGVGPAATPQGSTPGQRTPQEAPAQQLTFRAPSVMLPANMVFATVPGGRPGELTLTTGPPRRASDSSSQMQTSDRFGRYRDGGTSSNGDLKALDSRLSMYGSRSNTSAPNRSCESSPPPSDYEANSISGLLYPTAPNATKLIQPGQAGPSLQPLSPERAGNASHTWSEIDASKSNLQASQLLQGQACPTG